MGAGDTIKEGWEWLASKVNRRGRLRREAWANVAARRGGHATEGTRKFWTWVSPTLNVPVGEVAVLVDIYVISTGQTTQVYTRFRSNYLLGVGPSFKVYAAGIIGSVGSALGFEDVELGGNPEFDEQFIVRTADPEAARIAWTSVAKSRMLAHKKGLEKIVAKGPRINMLRPGTVSDEGTLDGCIDVVGEIASYGSNWLLPFRAIPGAVWVPPQGPWNDRSTPCARVERRGALVWVHPKVDGVGLSASASIEIQRKLPTFFFGADGAGRPLEGSEVPEGVLNGDAAQALIALGETTLDYDGKYLRITPNGEVTVERLSSAVDAATAIALGGGDVYR